MRRLPIICLLACAALLVAACSPGKYLADGERFLGANRIDLRMADSSEATPEVESAMSHASNYLTQKPNSRVLGIPHMYVGLGIYCLSSPNRHGMLNNYLRRTGQAPRIYDEDRTFQSVRQLEGLLEQKGCFGSTVWADTAKLTRHGIHITYHIRATQRYAIDEVTYHCNLPEMLPLVERWENDALIHAGDYYDQERLGAERTRLANAMRDAGYYYASPENITFLIDTTYHSSRLSIEVNINAESLKVYHINNIYVYPNSTARLQTDAASFDTLIHSTPQRNRLVDYQFVYDKPMSIHPQTIGRTLLLFPGMTYRPRIVSATYNSLLNLRNFKYINIEFSPSPASTDSLPLLDAHVRLINATQQKLSLSLELTNASPLGSTDTSTSFLGGGNLGLQTAIEYQHKNLFHGAELFRMKGSLLMELPKLGLFGSRDEGGLKNIFSSFEASVEASLDMPDFLLPFTSGILWQRTHPHTLISLGGSYQYHYYFERILANTSFGYTWSTQRTRQHQLLPIELTYVSILSLDEAFAQRLAGLSDLRLKYQYSSHFIFDARYDYAYSNQHAAERRDFHTVRLSVESAGNLLSAFSGAFGTPADTAGIRSIFGVPFAQYIRASAEYTRYLYHGNRSSFVVRGLLGAGLPYGNSVSMPYEKSFFGGGSTTLRAWQLRHLGPGAYDASGDLLERVGDLQLVVNLEERFHIASIFEGAIFADLGNVWLLYPSEQYPEGNFSPSSFWREVAVGIGLGLRVNVSIATLRLDLAIPLYDPGYATALRWRPPHWKSNQIAVNFGIGYPF